MTAPVQLAVVLTGGFGGREGLCTLGAHGKSKLWEAAIVADTNSCRRGGTLILSDARAPKMLPARHHGRSTRVIVSPAERTSDSCKSRHAAQHGQLLRAAGQSRAKLTKKNMPYMASIGCAEHAPRSLNFIAGLETPNMTKSQAPGQTCCLSTSSPILDAVAATSMSNKCTFRCFATCVSTSWPDREEISISFESPTMPPSGFSTKQVLYILSSWHWLAQSAQVSKAHVTVLLFEHVAHLSSLGCDCTSVPSWHTSATPVDAEKKMPPCSFYD